MNHERQFKAQARKLADLLAHHEGPVRYQDALSIAAQVVGSKDWKTLSARLKRLDRDPLPSTAPHHGMGSAPEDTDQEEAETAERYHLVGLSSDISEDDYEQGLGESTGCGYDNEKIGRTFDSLEALVKYLADHYGLPDQLVDYEWEGRHLCTSRQVANHSEAQNGGWMTPTEEEIAAWQEGKLKLYSEDYLIELHRLP